MSDLNLPQQDNRGIIMTITRFLTTVVCLTWISLGHSAPQLGKDPLRDVIAAMTLEEKVGMVMGTGMNLPGISMPPEFMRPAGVHTDERVAGAAGNTYAIPRLGIPSLVLADGPAGLRIQPLRESAPDSTYYATAFPIATALAASWDTALVERVGRAMGDEDREYGVDIMLAPALNLHRTPLGGRNFEYYSEDPLLSGKMAAALVRGVQSRGVGTSIKHYVANNQEWNRFVINEIIDERSLREMYLKGFEIAIKEGRPWTVMSSYNKVNGSYTSESARLLKKILRDQWGFTGLVMTDWLSGQDAIAQQKAGNDLLMPGTAVQQKALLAAVREGKLDEAILDRNIENILNVVLQTHTFKHYRYSDKPDLAGNAVIARNAATEGMVLLKNKNKTLPLPTGTRLALFGNSSYDMVTGGTGSGNVNEAYSISLQKGLMETGFMIDDKLAESYNAYIKQEKAARPPLTLIDIPSLIPELDVSRADVESIAEKTDTALITIGRISHEQADLDVEKEFNLHKKEKKLISDVSDIFHNRGKKVVVVLNIGGTIETASWRDQVDSILIAWEPGQEGGYAIADVISGKVNPSGKLVDTFPIKLADDLSMASYPGTVLEAGDPNDTSLKGGDRAAEVKYAEGIWVGYRYFNTRNIAVAYPFGYGLSYTDFAYSDIKLSSDRLEDTLTVSVAVTNAGNVTGSEVVQLYLTAPKGSLPKPALELKGFGKTRLLQPGEAQTLSFKLTSYDLASFDTASSSWLADAGSYTISIGASSIDIRLKKIFIKPEASHINP